jgi:tight adherence protein C
LICTFVVMPLFVLYLWFALGLSLIGVVTILVGGFTIPQLPLLRIKRRARKRAHAIETAMPDALDLLVVCAEGGLSLDGAIQQVAQRTRGVLASELQRLLQEIGNGMARREAFLALTERSQSESLKIFCTTIIQADKMGMSIASTLRTLAETMRTRRRQAAETQARKAPIKMMPFLVIFMIPSLFIVILGPAVLSIIDFIRDVSKM